MISKRVQGFTESVIREMTRINIQLIEAGRRLQKLRR